MLGVEVLDDEDWNDFDGAAWPWAQRIWNRKQGAVILLESAPYLNVLDESNEKESPT
jgi:hypothetical protein